MVLQGNKRKRETDVAIEPELERDEENLGGLVLRRPLLERTRMLRLIETFTTKNRSSDHVLITSTLAGRDGKVIPDLEPITELTVNLLATDFDVDFTDEVMTKIIDPSERNGRALNTGNLNLEVDTVNKITVTGDQGRDTFSEVTNTLECLLDSFESKIRMATVNDFEDICTPPFGVF